MDVWGVPVLASVEEMVGVLKVELLANNVNLLKDIKPTNGNLQVTCISHGGGVEKKPALGILTRAIIRDGRHYPEGTCNCYVCGYRADFPTFISNCFGYNDAGNFGFKWITTHFVNLAISERKQIELNMSRDTQKRPETTQAVTEEELQRYRYFHPYMTERKLTERVIEYFDVGYDAETDCLTFPVKDMSGKVLFVQRRAVRGKFFKNAEASLRGSVVYGLHEVYKNLKWIKRLFVTESIIDALTWWGRGEAGVATLGAIPTTSQIALLRKLPLRKFVSSYDNDFAGYEGFLRLKRELGDEKILYDLKYPDGVKDVNQLTDEQFGKLSMSLF